MTPPADPRPVSRFASAFDAILLACAAGLAVPVSSFVAKNSDVWQHLALGRLIATGQYDFSTDPLSYATEGQRWVNHAWLTDWLSYQFFRTAGGSGLVAGKAVLLAVPFLLAAGALRRDRPLWLPAGFLALAVVALSARAALQPVVVSCVLFAILLRLMQTGGKAYRWIPLLAAMWVNLDGWYILAPVAVAIHWLAGRRRIPIWLPPATFAACLLSPFHIYGLTLPIELSPAFWSSELARDPRVANAFASPFTAGFADNASFWAFCALVAIGTAILIFRRSEVERWEGILWLIVVGLAAWQARLIPFCAVAGAIIFARHIQESTALRSWGRAGRWGALIAILGCAGLAYSGWMHGGRGRDRVLGWDVYADPSLVRAAETLAKLRGDGRLKPEGRVLGSTPDVANTLAWFAPGERGYLDTRWDLHAGRIASTNVADDPPANLGIAAILLYDPSAATLSALAEKDRPWTILTVEGRAVWLTLAAPNTAESDARRIAFSEVNSSPVDARLPRHRDWWKPAVTMRLDRNYDAASAATQLNLHVVANGRNPAWPVAAVRLARRAIAADPDDSQAWLTLAKAYALLGATVEGPLAPQFGLLAESRRVQRITALNHAVIANPESEAALDGLATSLAEVGYFDRSLAERRRQLASVRRRGDAERAAALEKVVADLENEVFDREASFQVQTLKLSGDPLARARIALGLGLAALAQDILLKASSDLYGAEGLRLLAGLLIGTGQSAEAETMLAREEFKKNPGGLGLHEIPSRTSDGKSIVYRLPAYDWFRYLLAAATGLGDAPAALGQLRGYLSSELAGVSTYVNSIAVPVSKQVAADIGLAMSGAILPRIVIEKQRFDLVMPVEQSRYLIVERADLAVLEGWCELEAGRTAAALQRYDAALADYAATADLRVAPGKTIAEMYRKELAH